MREWSASGTSKAKTCSDLGARAPRAGEPPAGARAFACGERGVTPFASALERAAELRASPGWDNERLSGDLYPILARWKDGKSGEPIDVFLIDSNRRRGKTLYDNAIGRVGGGQRARLRALALASIATTRVAVLHHHVAAHPRIGLSWNLADPTDGLMLCDDGPGVLRVCREIGVTTILHGHKHVGFVGLTGDIWVRSAPSTVYGCSWSGDTAGIDWLSVDPTGLTGSSSFARRPSRRFRAAPRRAIRAPTARLSSRCFPTSMMRATFSSVTHRDGDGGWDPANSLVCAVVPHYARLVRGGGGLEATSVGYHRPAFAALRPRATHGARHHREIGWLHRVTRREGVV